MLQRRLLVLSVVTSAVSFAIFVCFRVATGSADLDFLVWNLALAWVPLAAALAIDDVRSTPLAVQVPLLALWLAFFPNAPYLVTDIIHIDPHGGSFTSILGDVAIAGAAPAGLALGFSSLALVERSLRERFGAGVALAASVASLAVASVGIYLGRVEGLNSWDLIAQPRAVADVLQELVLDPLRHPLAVAGTLALCAALAASYLRFRRLTELER